MQKPNKQGLYAQMVDGETRANLESLEQKTGAKMIYILNQAVKLYKKSLKKG